MDLLKAINPINTDRNIFSLGSYKKFNPFESERSSLKFNKAVVQFEKTLRDNPVIQSKYNIVKIRLTRNQIQMKEMLSLDMMECLILGGKESVQYILFPFLHDIINGNDLNKQEKDDLIDTLRTAYKNSIAMQNRQFRADLKKIGLEGLKEFSENIDEIVKPYKVA